MASIDLVKKKIAQVFNDHGIEVRLMGQADVVKNALGEVIAAITTELSQTIVLKRLTLKLQLELAGDLPDGTVDIVAPPDTLIKEASIIKVDARLYQVIELIPYRAFGEVICYVGRGERADGNE
ncbi:MULTISPECIES: hypothetical protein [unclassified Paenibacillus]|uniref:hypothetical protein n=1 Tax=unclassified Paenibacillus TaxID=185978 RepID=UPI0036296318